MEFFPPPKVICSYSVKLYFQTKFLITNFNLTPMKNIFRLLMAALVICATSCTKEDVSSTVVGNGEVVEVNFSANLSELGTRVTTGSGAAADRLQVNVFDAANGNQLTELSRTDSRSSKDESFNFSLPLVKGMTYDIVLWADKVDNTIYTLKGKVVTADYSAVKSNDENLDAFCFVFKGFDPTNPAHSPHFTLRRPFAQLNAATNDKADVAASGIELTTSEVKVLAYNQFDIFEGTVPQGATKAEVTFGAANIPGGDLNGNATYEYLSANYLFVPATGALTDAVYTFKGKKTNSDVVTFTGTSYSAIPLKPNHRTNILGALLTKPADFVVDINAGFTDSYDHVIWDGKSVSEPDYDATTQTYTIDNGSELAWLADTVNGTTRAAADSMKGKTIVLSESIDLGGAEWTPIGVGGNHFMGTFDGNGKTISNFRISKRPGNCNQAALFGTISGTVAIQNFTIKDVEIDYPGADDFYAAAVVGTFYGHVTLKDIVVEDCYISGNNKVAGLAAHDGVCSSLLIDNCHVKNSVLETLNEEDGGNVAGLLGLFQGVAKKEVANQPLYGVHEVKRSSVTGCTIKGGNKNSEGKRSSGEFIANFIGKDDQSLHINNCKIENNTFTQTGTYTSIYLPFVGGARNDDGKGTIYVDGKKIVAEGVTFDEQAKTYYVSTAAGLAWVAGVVNATTPYTPTIFDEATVELTNNIDLNNEEWIPIGDDRSQRTEWHGVFDGKGYTVSNVKITKKTNRDDENKSSYGLFGNVKGTVKNLTVEKVSISGAPKFIGALVGRLNDGLIENCHVKSSNVECKNWTIGGLVGQFNNGTISGCSVEGTTVTGYAAVGAIVGIALNSGERIIENCLVKNCTIAQKGSFGGDYDKMFGAVAGALYSGTLTVDFVNCTVENTTILDEISDTICGYAAEGDTILINGKITATPENLGSMAATEGAEIYLSGAEYTIPATFADNVTIIGDGNTVFKEADVIKANNITFKNVKFDNEYGTALKLIASGTFENCQIVGPQGLYMGKGDQYLTGDTTFRGCTIVGEVYGINVNLAGHTLTLDDCDITGWNSFGDNGKVIVRAQTDITNSVSIRLQRLRTAYLTLMHLSTLTTLTSVLSMVRI